MKINQFTDNSLRVLLYLGLKQELATIGEIAKAFCISKNHLVKVVHLLGQKGYVHSYKGKGGGIELAVNPEAVRIGDFVREFEPMDLLECFDVKTNTCPIQGFCGLEKSLYQARDAFIDSLNKQTLQDYLQVSSLYRRRRQLLGLGR